jgi:hypothetical protein
VSAWCRELDNDGLPASLLCLKFLFHAAQDDIVLMPSCYDALSAKLIERAGAFAVAVVLRLSFHAVAGVGLIHIDLVDAIAPNRI